MNRECDRPSDAKSRHSHGCKFRSADRMLSTIMTHMYNRTSWHPVRVFAMVLCHALSMRRCIHKRQLRAAGHSRISDQIRWRPSIVSRPLPAEATFSTTPVAVLASLNDFPFNFGHALFDFLLPVFNMLSISGKTGTQCFVCHGTHHPFTEMQ